METSTRSQIEHEDTFLDGNMTLSTSRLITLSVDLSLIGFSLFSNQSRTCEHARPEAIAYPTVTSCLCTARFGGLNEDTLPFSSTSRLSYLLFAYRCCQSPILSPNVSFDPMARTGFTWAALPPEPDNPCVATPRMSIETAATTTLHAFYPSCRATGSKRRFAEIATRDRVHYTRQMENHARNEVVI
jgi:hypothetical protein